MPSKLDVRCPKCGGDDVSGFNPTRTGRAYYCRTCGSGWKLTVEDEVLGMIGASLAARRRNRERDTPDESG